jgi:hypothetical protein
MDVTSQHHALAPLTQKIIRCPNIGGWDSLGDAVDILEEIKASASPVYRDSKGRQSKP